MQFTSMLVCDGVAVAGQTKISGMIPISSKSYAKTDHSNGRVTWEGDVSDDAPILDDLFAGGELEFYWTRDGQPHPDYRKYKEVNDSDENKRRRFKRPDDDSITDWKQIVTTADGKSSVTTGNVRRGGDVQLGDPWLFFPLSELAGNAYRIPDLAPTFGDPELTIYTAVNLELYLQSNPEGFSNGEWEIGQTLDELGVVIVNGQVPGVEGIYWAVSDFIFDPLSATGWVPAAGPAGWLDSLSFQMNFGNIAVMAAHEKEAASEVFFDSFESGDTSAWPLVVVPVAECLLEPCF